MAARRTVAAAASPLSPLVDGPPGPARVLGVFPRALYLAGPSHGEVLPVVSRDGLALPTAVRLAVPSDQCVWGVSPGDTVSVGHGRISLPGSDIDVRRWWRPSRVRRGSAGAGGAVRQCPRGHLAAEDVRVVSGPPVRPPTAVASLVGRGPGLTPVGDDALCGALLMRRALGCSGATCPDPWPAVADRLATTTSLSASLLVSAADGYGLPDVVALVDALAVDDPSRLSALVLAVAGIGHTSGWALVAGVTAVVVAHRGAAGPADRGAICA